MLITTERKNHTTGESVVTGFDERGKIKLSMKRVDQETGEIIPQKPKEDRRDEQAAG